MEVERNPGWSFDLSESMLEVDPEGGDVVVKILQLGNLASIPYITGSMYGWNITFPDNLSAIQPFSSSDIVIHAIPPTDSLAGEIGELTLIAQDGDGLGEIEVNIPLRVGANESIVTSVIGDWKVTEQGGVPLAWVTNTGNTLANV